MIKIIKIIIASKVIKEKYLLLEISQTGINFKVFDLLISYKDLLKGLGDELGEDFTGKQFIDFLANAGNNKQQRVKYLMDNFNTAFDHYVTETSARELYDDKFFYTKTYMFLYKAHICFYIKTYMVLYKTHICFK